MLPEGVILPILPLSVNHTLPSGPFEISSGDEFVVGRGYSVIIPLGEILPILLPFDSVNHKLPSDPVVILYGVAPTVGRGNSVMGGVVLSALGCLKLSTPIIPPATKTRSSTAIGHRLLRHLGWKRLWIAWVNAFPSFLKPRYFFSPTVTFEAMII